MHSSKREVFNVKKKPKREVFNVLKKPKREVFIFFITLLFYNTNVGGMHGSAFFVSNLEQLA
ncbi:hypothetical protein VN0211_15300 [Helicobacter pylori]|nr:hypothetical protein VN0211_15300 [Helicobacter pylori]